MRDNGSIYTVFRAREDESAKWQSWRASPYCSLQTYCTAVERRKYFVKDRNNAARGLPPYPALRRKGKLLPGIASFVMTANLSPTHYEQNDNQTITATLPGWAPQNNMGIA